MTDKVQKIREEVERIQLYTQSEVLKQVLDYIDKVQEEPVSGLDNGNMPIERWKKAVEAASNQRNYRCSKGLTETRDDYFVDGVQWADEHPKEESVSEDLEIELEKYIKGHFTIDTEQLDRFGIDVEDYMYSMDKSDMLALVEHFTNWQKTKEEPVSDDWLDMSKIDCKIQYENIESGIHAHAEDYSFNIESQLFNQLTKEQQELWRKEIEQAIISGGHCGVELARDKRYKENQEPVSEELEEACEQLAENARKHKAETSSPFFSQTDYKQGVIDGAKWKEEQFEKNRLAACDKQTEEEAEIEQSFVMGIIECEHRQPTFNDAIKYGMRLQKEQMMAKAIDVEVKVDAGGYPYIVRAIEMYDYDKDVPLAKAGDKVKLIVIKEDSV